MISKQMIREKISTKLKELGWNLDHSSPYCNVAQEEKNADYILKDQNLNPLLVLEVEKYKLFNVEKNFSTI
ncbi:MAG: hypothetical protein Q8807_02600 ['Waltheria sp.' little leaf phytoplasma]|nr:hypothetical protein ['Waltheria sp.' little leaf phytoplasma]